jgi:hypothetical protein
MPKTRLSPREAKPGAAPGPPGYGICPESGSDSRRASPAYPPSRTAIERLVREELGCTCPDEVFECILEGPLALPGLAEPGRRVAIGGRLLVYLIEAEDPVAAVAGLPAWISAGRAERNAAGMNRLRLVVVTARPETMTPALRAEFEALPDRDERIHLHVLPPAAIAGIRAPGLDAAKPCPRNSDSRGDDPVNSSGFP